MSKCMYCDKPHSKPNSGRPWFCSYECDYLYVTRGYLVSPYSYATFGQPDDYGTIILSIKRRWDK